MASSSSAAAASLPFSSLGRPKEYDVFISFRGEDTRTNFMSHLHGGLCRKDIRTYVDARLDRGDVISVALMKAIEDSYISLVIFSENYACSKWCLDELTKIIECKELGKQVVIPVFYKVDPSHVSKQMGSYKSAFARHEKDLKDDKKVLKWKTALVKAANLAGYHSHNYR